MKSTTNSENSNAEAVEPSHQACLPDAVSPRFAQRREDFINAATEAMNRKGMRGMTLAEMAATLGMSTPSVRHYFKSKEELAIACIERSITRVDALISEAAKRETSAERISAFIAGYLDLLRRIRIGEEPPLAHFGDVQALMAQNVEAIVSGYQGMTRKLQSFFRAEDFGFLDRDGRRLRTMYLFIITTAVPSWIERYEVAEYAWVAAQLADIVLNGLAADRAESWTPIALPELVRPHPSPKVRPLAQDTFLFAATQLINEQGYRGASIDKIAARLEVTKGAIYHHHDAKTDLVAECFRRSYGIVLQAQRLALALEASGWDKLSAACASLMQFQQSPEGPLLANSALSALPPEVGRDMQALRDHTSYRFATLVSAGIIDGSIRRVDANIAAQFLTAGVNAAGRLGNWLRDGDAEAAGRLYLRPLLRGIYDH